MVVTGLVAVVGVALVAAGVAVRRRARAVERPSPVALVGGAVLVLVGIAAVVLGGFLSLLVLSLG